MLCWVCTDVTPCSVVRVSEMACVSETAYLALLIFTVKGTFQVQNVISVVSVCINKQK